MSLNNFQILSTQPLGEGSYSKVFKVKRLVDNQIYAIKKIKMNSIGARQKQNALTQIRILASIDHPNILSFKQSFFDQTGNYLYIVMQYADDGDLLNKITNHSKNNTKFTQQQIWSIAIQLIRGLKVLHDNKILHRDIKTANIFLFKNGAVKLGDMNVSKLSKSMCKTQTGTPYYSSPQVWKQLPYDKKADIWSLGCVIYETIALKPPFRANDIQGLYKKVIRGFYPHIPQQYSQQLNINPQLRSNCDKMLQLPIVTKHVANLPSQMQQQLKIQQKLISTIRIKFDAKQKVVSNMPKPRYVSTIETSIRETNRKLEDDYLKDFHKISLKNVIHHNSLDDNQDIIEQRRFQLPQIKNRHNKIRSQNNIYQSDNLLGRLVNPVKIQKKQKVKENSQIKHGLSFEKKIPVILQGRLRSISPENIKKILQQQKQKQKIYSIIGNN